ncbi:hypothetical protein CDAR_67151 [Caerostris darwini]|uniref:Uncharacterized protein n=1 Tax=Caerostris darwini TaxID=1538125 RepID=A0AAV4QVQ2_9ARAC|nr:hypothetical protein CDAR_67151 [Caerostris darwini]
MKTHCLPWVGNERTLSFSSCQRKHIVFLELGTKEHCLSRVVNENTLSSLGCQRKHVVFLGLSMKVTTLGNPSYSVRLRSALTDIVNILTT